MQNIEAFILRRCYPVPVTFADLRRAHHELSQSAFENGLPLEGHIESAESGLCDWQKSLKEATGALDEVYAVADGREVRVALAAPGRFGLCGTWDIISPVADRIADLLDAADRAGYWERPHEVRLDLQERAITHNEVARAVMVGQQHLKRKAVRS